VAAVAQQCAGKRAAVACVAGWTFEPAVRDGRSVATVARAPVTFRIFGGPPPDSMWDGKDGRELLVTGLDSKGAGLGEWLVQFEAEVFGHWELPEPLRSGPLLEPVPSTWALTDLEASGDRLAAAYRGSGQKESAFWMAVYVVLGERVALYGPTSGSPACYVRAADQDRFTFLTDAMHFATPSP
jgi:hypothetical protein